MDAKNHDAMDYSRMNAQPHLSDTRLYENKELMEWSHQSARSGSKGSDDFGYK